MKNLFQNIIVKCDSTEEIKFVLNTFFKSGLFWRNGSTTFLPEREKCILVVSKSGLSDLFVITWDNYDKETIDNICSRRYIKEVLSFYDFQRKIKPKFIEVEE